MAISAGAQAVAPLKLWWCRNRLNAWRRFPRLHAAVAHLLALSGPDQLERRSLECHVMEIRGRVHYGVVVLEGEPLLPEGAAVSVLYPVASVVVSAGPRRRVQLPLVPSDRPGSIHLSDERVAELLADDDVHA